MHSPDYHIHNMEDNYPDTLGFQDQDFFQFQASDFFQNNQWMDEDILPPFPAGYNAQHLSYTPHEVIAADNNTAAIGNTSFQQGLNYDRNDGRQMIQRTDKVAFKTKSEVEILDDGFKWRKYGKKMVKNSPNPRNYYKCSVEGCPVKKRVERDTEDARYVVTTYEGIHNHEVPLV